MMTDRINFRVNGLQCSVSSDVSSTTTLLQYLRERLELRGTKYMCLQAGCGACIVAVSKYPGAPLESVNSCLVSITSCQNWEITTIEDIGNRLKGYHPLQTTLAGNNGSQCGHCSPGWIMAMFSLLAKKSLTMLEIEKSLGSNICRCTGYRSILEAFKKFAKDAPVPVEIPDIEDLRVCDKTGKSCKGKKCEDSEWCFVTNADVLVETVICIELMDNKKWYRVQELTDVFKILQKEGDDSYMLVAGNTAKAVYPVEDYPRILIDISDISALKGHMIDQNLIIGAATTLTELIDIFDSTANTENFSYLKILGDHLSNVAHIPVRNIATIAGNLMVKHLHNDFQSDVFLLLLTIGGQITIENSTGLKKSLTMTDFLKEDMTGKVILNILLPPLCASCKIVTYKVTPRAQNALAIVNAGFFYKIANDNRVEYCRIVFGGLSPNFARSVKTENCLVNQKLFTNETLQLAIKTLKEELVITENVLNFSVEYRRQLAIGLFYKGLLSLCPEAILHPRYRSGSVKLRSTRPVSVGRQVFETDSTVWPLNEPIPNIDALIQCAGEAKYTDDIPSKPNQVFAAFVTSTVALADIIAIDATKALAYPGVIAFYSAKDIQGLNSFTPADNSFYTTNEEVFCDGKVKYYNQVIGVIVAETQHIATQATKMVSVKYGNIKKPILDVKIATTISSRNNIYTTINATEKGNDITKVIKGTNTLRGQYHFPMETIACVSFPSEKGIEVHPTSQWLDSVQVMTSRMLKMDQNMIDVHITRLGGAFGLKISRSNQVAMACNLIVNKIQRPCRFVQTLENNLKIVGKREPCYMNFEAGVNGEGEIQYMNFQMYEDNGYIVNELLAFFGTDIYHNCYVKKRWNYTEYNTLTDTASTTFCRAPGTLNHIAVIEMAMEQIACELSKDPIDVRLKNLDIENFNDLKDMYVTLREKAQYDQRKAAVLKFNAENRWLKRGLRFVLMRWPSSASVYLDITLSVYHGDGSVAIVHSGVEMGQGVNTKATQVCAYLLNIPIEKIKIKPNNTITAPNCFASGNSLTSQNVAIGIKRCCEELLKRLQPIREQMKNPTWEALVTKAHESGVNLKTTSITNNADENKHDVFGVALAEVEIDVITGEWECLQVDISEDVGRSVSPLIDIGQIEGAFIMGLGNCTIESVVTDQNTGEILTDSALKYHVPQARDVPQNFNIYFRKRPYSNNLVFGAKVTGEPAACMAIVVPIAMREAIVSARTESGIPADVWFDIDVPYTMDKICLASKSNFGEFKFY